jgi:hypothetical protein
MEAQQSPSLDRLLDAVTADVEANRKLTQVMVDKIFSFAELGFHEVETSKYLVSLLRENGFEVEEGISGMPTAWWAKWGSGKPVIAFGSDIDGIPKASQKPGVAYRDPLVEGAPGHGEGHNSGTGRERDGCARTQEDHGARTHTRNAGVVAGGRGGTDRRQGVVRSRRPVRGTSTP